MNNLARLRELMEKATEGEWLINNPNRARVGSIRNKDGLYIYDSGYKARQRGDAELIVAMRNLLPALIAVAEAAGNLHPNHSTGELDKALAELEGVKL